MVGNSIFQIFLCGVMWGMDRFERPPWTTGSSSRTQGCELTDAVSRLLDPSLFWVRNRCRYPHLAML